MKTRKLGRNGPEISAIGLGCMGMTGTYGAADEAASIAAIHAALDARINFLDTSDHYGHGENQKIIARAIKGRRESVVISSKFGNTRTADGRDVADGSPANVVRACEESLARMEVDAIDVFTLSRIDPNVPVEETVGAMARLVEEGKIRMVGLSEVAPATLRRGHAVHPIAALQTEYALCTRFAEAEHLPLCQELGIAYVAYSPLGRGLITGALKSRAAIAADDGRQRMPRFEEGNLAENVALLEPLEQLAAEKGCSPTQIALAWLLAKGDFIIPIPGARSRAHVLENAAAADIELGADEIASLDQAFPLDIVAGERSGPLQMKTKNL